MEQTLADRISTIVTHSGLKKTQFAEKINISQPFLSQICSGSKMPSDRTLADICRESGVNRIWLETGDGEPYAKLTRVEELTQIFLPVLSGIPTEKNIFLEAVARLPDEVYPVLIKSWIEAAERMKQLLDENKKTE